MTRSISELAMALHNMLTDAENVEFLTVEDLAATSEAAARLEAIGKACAEFHSVEFPDYEAREAKLSALIGAIEGEP